MGYRMETWNVVEADDLPKSLLEVARQSRGRQGASHEEYARDWDLVVYGGSIQR